MKLTTFRQLLRKYHDGTATEAERYIVEQWYESFNSDLQEVPNLGNDTEKSLLKDRILHKILKRDAEANLHRIRRNTRWPFGIAAGLLLILGISTWFYLANNRDWLAADHAATNVSLHTVETGSKQVKVVQLPDHTMVWLNANSKLEISLDYNRDNRKVRLEGEAFFEVEDDAIRPFLVVADGVAVNVLGTSFNIQSYKGLQAIKVTVATGRVSVTDTASRHLAELTEGQELAYQRMEGSYRLHRSNVTDARAWRDGQVVLDMAGFDQLTQGFYNLYGVKLKTDNSEVAAYRYTLTLQSTIRMREALELICTIVGKNYRKEANGDITIY